MTILIVGAGTIGLTYAWLLSANHNVTVYVRPEKIASCEQKYEFDIQDLRDKKQKHFTYRRPTSQMLLPVRMTRF
ncbi:hypothetical protein AZF37_00575 [endosymbiont 'TC1' of Trimyema compressum]|uniref:ketopantoate reductase family protein n=1 Tax=endosymbiont 'TC1' of Trimyema compressum TaxID=243899 RepID=UPI0007F09DE8|nr:2-dehydropantoate 2-reductase N-terminal domain-containing protein [endosymbiont 'TC1' of Trimyema compressum]AMP19868.1 hypothetical protein AZF37_00575 [endosymbiont 'TC1' of Trimyema compressum]